MLREIKESAKNYRSFVGTVTSHVKKDKKLLESILNSTSFLNLQYDFIPFNQRLFHIWNNINEILLCPICGEVVKIHYITKNNNKNIFSYYSPNCGKKECINQFKINNCLEKYGVEFTTQLKETNDKRIENTLKKYGVEFTTQLEETKIKAKATLLKNYGVEYPMQSEKVKQKVKATLFNNYGVENPSQSVEIRNKYKATLFNNYGVEYPMQSEKVKDKSKNTCIEKYGVENPSQSVEIFEKQQRFKRKPYTLPSGKIVKLQGYEHFYLNDYFYIGGLEKNIQYKKIKAIPYVLNEKKHLYHPDFYLKNEHKIIEVKSGYTFKKELEENIAKQSACIEQGFDFEFFIYDRKGNRLSEIELMNKS